VKVLIIENGPLKVMGGVACFDDASGNPVPGGDEPAIFLCRCGGSQNKPFCDGTHKRNGFDGTLTALEPADG
jgi:CDGSH-type Zn-finger protein